MGLPCDPTLWSFKWRPNWRLDKDPRFQEIENGQQSVVANRERVSRLATDHRPHVRPFPQKPEPRKLQLNPNAAFDIEPYESWDDLPTIHFPDEQISTQHLMLLYHSQFYHTVHKTLDLVEKFWLHAPS